MHAEKFRRLGRWCLPWRKQDGHDQNDDHPVEHREVELIRYRGRMLWKSRRAIRSPVESPTALDTETVDLRLRPATGRTDLHDRTTERSRDIHTEKRLQERNLFSQWRPVPRSRARSDIPCRTRSDASYRFRPSHRGKGRDLNSHRIQSARN
jgi:hypothetical protein